jgi:creatinine amidohydrolase/Fe(II)-dependent formamide hydrolase-like protein
MKSTTIGIVSYLTCILGLLLPPDRVFGQIYHVQEMNTEQIKALDREKTVVLLPVGILEEHGPYLPSGSDVYITERRTSDLANALVERPGWKVLIFPLIPLGTGPANTVGRKYVFPGSYTVRPSTLRTIFMDLGTDLGEQGFRWIFIVNAHLGLSHNRILNQAGDYFHDTYGGHMVNLAALIYRPPGQSQTRGEEEQREDAGSTHAGASETSLLLYFRPELVSPGYKNATPLPARNQKQRNEIAKATDWPGYWGSPRLATAAAAAARWKGNSTRLTDLANKILDGFDYIQMKRLGDEVVVGQPTGEVTFTKHNQEIESKQQEWLKKKGLD